MVVIACPASFSCAAAALLLSVLAACPLRVAAAVNATGHWTAGVAPVVLKQVALRAAKPAVHSKDQFAALQKGPLYDKAHGQHFLTKQQLEPIDSIACLQDKQRHPNRPCRKITDKDNKHLGPLRIGHYPHYQDRSCHSEQEFFCDPTDMLIPADQHTVAEHLRAFKERTLVNCGQLESVLDPDAERRSYEKKKPFFTGRLGLEDYREFNLAVMLADEWPTEERDPKSMQYFGRVVMTEWGLMPIYNGVDNGNPVNLHNGNWEEYHTNCPNTAVLFILPRYELAYLLSPSEEFISANRGGPEVIAATIAGLKRGGVKEAIHAGIDMIQKVLKVSIPQSVQTQEFKKQYLGSVTKDLMHSDATFVWAIRFAYALVVFLAVFFLGSCIYFNVAGEKKERRPRTLFSSDHRITLRAENVSA